jgi:hypothetical protein
MSKEKAEPDDRLSEFAKSSDQEPGKLNPPAPKTALERFDEQVQALLRSGDSSHFDDSWEGCGRDAAG